jgi:hypothetical protein
MLARGYTVLGSLLLLGYSAVEFQGWEFGSAVRQRPAPRPGVVLAATSWGRSSYRAYSSSSSSGRVPGTGGGFGGK